MKVINLLFHPLLPQPGFEDIDIVSTNIPEGIINAIFEYEHFILMKKHFTMYKYIDLC